MKMQTASEAVSFSQELEEQAAKFYEQLAEVLTDYSDTFKSFANENRKFGKQIHRTYISVISDAIEGSYAINLESEEFAFDADVPQKISLSQAVQKAKAIENKIIDYYERAAEQSKELMADVPRNMSIVAKKRRNTRLPKLEGLS